MGRLVLSSAMGGGWSGSCFLLLCTLEQKDLVYETGFGRIYADLLGGWLQAGASTVLQAQFRGGKQRSFALVPGYAQFLVLRQVS